MAVKRNALPYELLAGVVPCPRGWLVQPARLHGIAVVAENPWVARSVAEILDYRPDYSVIAIAAPVGLPEDPFGGFRGCDRVARRMLGWPRRSAVLPVPSRKALAAPSFAKAQELEPWLTPLNYRKFKWWRDLAGEMQPYLQRRVFAALPELTFQMLNGDRPLRSPRYWVTGRTERWNLLRDRLPGLEMALSQGIPAGAMEYHVLDAAALLWTARRIAGRAITRYPADPEWDDAGLRMEFVR
jgi:predicted RNase H-like nuclease